MSKMCPLGGCQQEKHACAHDKMMMGMAILGVLSTVAYFGLGLL
ncbi:MAG: hypothetical protein ACO3JL_04575 [Myxococcota bacterium]